MEIKHFNPESNEFKIKYSFKTDFYKLEPYTFLEVNFESESQLKSIRSSYYQWRKKYHPEWKGGVRLIDNTIRIIRWE